MKRLPRGELRLAELNRDRQVKENIFSNILNRYNEAKVVDAATIPDAFLVDEAEPPLVHRNIFDKLRKLALGPLLGIFLGIGLFVLFDYLDNI